MKIIIILILLILITGCQDNPNIDKDLVKCISENSILYYSTGCSACAKQKEIFKDSYEDLTKVDCVISPEKCREAGIIKVPTWEINNEKIIGIKTIEELKELTKC